MDNISSNIPLERIINSCDSQSSYFFHRKGKVYRFQNNNFFLFLDISGRLPYIFPEKDERGLLSFIFHPSKKNYYYYYTDLSGNEILIEGNGINERIILFISSEKKVTRLGGKMIFGKDEFLYLEIGDHDFIEISENLMTFYGKILRIDVNNWDKNKNYKIPLDNPFLYQIGTRPEIYSISYETIFGFSWNDGKLFSHIKDKFSSSIILKEVNMCNPRNFIKSK